MAEALGAAATDAVETAVEALPESAGLAGGTRTTGFAPRFFGVELPKTSFFMGSEDLGFATAVFSATAGLTGAVPTSSFGAAGSGVLVAPGTGGAGASVAEPIGAEDTGEMASGAGD